MATTLHAQPGVYALLLGSGVSTGAGIPTGWGVVRDLVRRAAAAADPDNHEAAQTAYADPETWWERHGDGDPLGYSNLLAAMAQRPAARRALLAGFFEPSEDDLESGLKVPSAAHRAVADLVKRGTVRVVVTTNFDRLTERALEDVGVSPQIISNVGGVAGMSPLQHSPATIIKLHGDYADLLQRNTVEELAEYPEEWNVLLDRIFSEYGLLISGWSAEWDQALVAALERQPIRRYPLFWDSRSAKGETAKRLVAQQNGTLVEASDANALFRDLSSRLDALDRLSDPPLTTALAVQRLKRYLPDERRRIDLHDLIMDRVDVVVEEVRTFPQYVGGDNAAFIAASEDVLDRTLAVTAPLAMLTAVGIQHDVDGRFGDLWVRSLQRLLQAPLKADGTFQEKLVALRKYPALLLLRMAGVACLQFDRESLLLDLLTKPTWREQFYERKEVIAGRALNDYKVVDADLVNALPRYTERWLFPPSHFIRDVTRDVLRDLTPDEEQFRAAHDDFEFRMALVQEYPENGSSWRMPGEFLLESRWSGAGPDAEARFREKLDQEPDESPWISYLGGRENLDPVLLSLRESLSKMRRYF